MLYKENEKKLISEPNCFYITKDKNGTRLYFDEKDYNHYVNSNKNSIKDVKEQSNELKNKIEVCDKRYKEALKKLSETYPLFNFLYNKKCCIIVDEAHRLSNNTSNQYKVVSDLIRKTNPNSIFLATGTPVTNNPLNLYYLLKLMML